MEHLGPVFPGSGDGAAGRCGGRPPGVARGLEQSGDARFLPRFLLLQGEQARYRGRTGAAAEALHDLEPILAATKARAEGWYLPELLRIQGELLLLRDGSAGADAAEQAFQQSLDEAQQQGALSWELRTATSMAQLWKDRGRLSEAGALLRRVRARFAESADTADMQAAKLLLDELS